MTRREMEDAFLAAFGAPPDATEYVGEGTVRGVAKLEGRIPAADIDSLTPSFDRLEYDGRMYSIRARDTDGAWHTLVSLFDSEAGGKIGWKDGTRRYKEEYSETIIEEIQLYQVEIED
jgi:hypothetical protein